MISFAKIIRELRLIAIILYIVIGLVSHTTFSQTKVKLDRADLFTGSTKPDGTRFNVISGNVKFTHDNTWIYCDTAVLYHKTNSLEALGHVKITDNDSITITANRLFYDGNTKYAKLRGNVVFIKKNVMTLYTDFLDYDRQAEKAYYFNNGKIVDNTNVLTSVKGYYEVRTDFASFKTNVTGENEDYTLTSDTLRYNSSTKIIYFLSPTEIIDSEGNVFNSNRGIYNTTREYSSFEVNRLESNSYILTADKLKSDDKNKYHRADNNVVLIAKDDDVLITGESGEYFEKEGLTKIYDYALLRVFTEDQDTLYITADTLVAIDHELDANKRLLAYHNVIFFQDQIQGKADSIAYFQKDSMMYFYGNPILWNEGNQITADSIHVLFMKKKIDKMFLTLNSFIISKDTLKNFNQVKGRNMVAHFKDNKIEKIYVDGNGESIFFALDDKDSTVIGMNKSLSSNLIIDFENNKVKLIHLYTNPDASFIPPHELKKPDKTLKGFIWREEEKPSKAEVIPIPKIRLKARIKEKDEN